MTIIVTKPDIITDVVGSYFYDKKMGFSSWAGRRRSCMTFFRPSMTEKTVVEARVRKISGCSQLQWVDGPSDARRFAHFCCTRTRVGARRWALTEPERGVRLLNPSDCTVGYALLNSSDRSMAVN